MVLASSCLHDQTCRLLSESSPPLPLPSPPASAFAETPRPVVGVPVLRPLPLGPRAPLLPRCTCSGMRLSSVALARPRSFRLACARAGHLLVSFWRRGEDAMGICAGHMRVEFRSPRTMSVQSSLPHAVPLGKSFRFASSSAQGCT